VETLEIQYRIEAVFGLCYFAAYLAYLFVATENELMHWVTLVFAPLLLLGLLQRRGPTPGSLVRTLATVGIARGNLRRGVVWAVVLGLLLGSLQFAMSRHSSEIWELLRTGRALLLFPLAFVLMVFTAAFTEEFFFRGVLQTRLTRLVHSKFIGVAVTSILFGIYHLPYAYMDPDWPSHGDIKSALYASLFQGIPLGVILGVLYERTKRNLFACVVLHAVFNSVPGMTMIKFGAE
jgi:membrane protease YdiL (CAAX protease family)